MIDRTGESLYLKNTLDGSNTAKQNALGKNDFLKLLVAQLKNQSPSKPMDDRQFISQMATFSTLEQMTNMNEKLTSFLQNQSENNWLADTQLIGKDVKWLDQNNDNVVSGTIQSVSYKNGQVQFETTAGNWIHSSQIVEVGLSSVK
ncbi:MAG TPA: flagellar hook assembly protein FlgD [Bacillales bacterium]|nr:flagellar hook assembly protein FlgD [Bacillales bacterium]